MDDDSAPRGLDDDNDDPLGLEPGESILAQLNASYAGRFERELNLPGSDRRPTPTPTSATMGSILRGGSMGGMSAMHRPRMTGVGRYLQWQHHAASVGFPVAGMAMLLGVSERRLLVYRATFVRGRPKQLAGSLPLRRVVQAAASRRAVSSRVLFVLDGGGIVTLETMSYRRGRRFVDTLLTTRDAMGHSRES